jgi:putative transcriptional regulator
VRFDTLAKLCRVLDCQPGDLLAFDSNGPDETD